MKIKMLVSMAGPDESWQPGDVREVGDSVALEWSRLGLATLLPSEPVVVKDEAMKFKAKAKKDR